MSDDVGIIAFFGALVSVVGFFVVAVFAFRSLAWIGRVRRASIFFPPAHTPIACDFADCGALNPSGAHYCRRCGRSLRNASIRGGTRVA